MRAIEEIKADIAVAERKIKNNEGTCSGDKYLPDLQRELYENITASIPLSDLSTLCDAWRDGRCVVLPYKRHERVYVIDDRVKKGYRISHSTKLGYYQVYADNTEPRIIAKTTAVEHWYGLDELFPTLDAVKEGVLKMHQAKRESCAKYGRVCAECKNDFCNSRPEADAALQKGAADEIR